MNKIIFKDRQSNNTDRKKLSIQSTSADGKEIIADITRYDDTVIESGTVINALNMNSLQDNIETELNRFEEKINGWENIVSNQGTTIKVNQQVVPNINFDSEPQTQINSKVSLSDLFNLIYPIGSVYISTSSVNPQTLFGGTWEAFAEGRTIVGVGTSDKAFVPNEIGGESSHVLSIDEMPSHSHTTNGYYTWTGASGYKISAGNNLVYSSGTNATGGSQGHNNLPPYIVTYIWKRVA